MTKKLNFMGVLVGVLLCLGSLARAGNLQDFQESKLDESQFLLFTSTGNSKAMRVTYVGSSTSAVVHISSHQWIAYAPFGTADSNAGTWRLQDAAYDTIGELCDSLDALSDYKCVLLGAKHDDDSALLRDQNDIEDQNDLKAVGGYEVFFDTGGATLGAHSTNDYNLSVGRTPANGKQLILTSCEVDANGSSPDIRVYGLLDIFYRQDGKNAYDQVDLEQITDDTEQTLTWSIAGGQEGLRFAKNSHVVVRAGNETSTQAAANDLRCQFKER